MAQWRLRHRTIYSVSILSYIWQEWKIGYNGEILAGFLLIFTKKYINYHKKRYSIHFCDKVILNLIAKNVHTETLLWTGR